MGSHGAVATTWLFQYAGQRGSGADQSACERTHGDFQSFGSLFVRQALDRHQHDHGALFFGQGVDCATNVIQGQAGLHGVFPVKGLRILVLDNLKMSVTPLLAADEIDVRGLNDAKHPTVQAGALLPLVYAGNGLFACGLNKIVGFRPVTGETEGKSPQSRQDGNQFLLCACIQGL